MEQVPVCTQISNDNVKSLKNLCKSNVWSINFLLMSWWSVTPNPLFIFFFFSEFPSHQRVRRAIWSTDLSILHPLKQNLVTGCEIQYPKCTHEYTQPTKSAAVSKCVLGSMPTLSFSPKHLILIQCK